MRPPTLQYFYLENPMFLLIAICLITILPWIGQGDFSTNELEEVAAANSALVDNQWLVPKTDIDNNTYKSPLTSWCIAVFSLPGGKVSTWSARLPSAIAFICLLCFSFIFFGKNLRFQDAFLSALVMLTCFGLHRESMLAGRDITFAFFVVLALQRLFRWEERKALYGFPIPIILILGAAGLTKGFIGVFLPIIIFAIYLCFLKYKLSQIFIKLLPVLLVSLVIPLGWDLIAFYQTGQCKLLLDTSDGLQFAYSFSVILGFLPWTLLLLFSLFGLKYKYLGKKTLWERMMNMDRIKLFSLVIIVVVLAVFCLPMYRSNINLIIVYPFIAIFVAEYVLYLIEYQSKTCRFFSSFIGLAGISLVIIWIISAFTSIEIFNLVIAKNRIYHFILIGLLVFSVVFLGKHLWKKNHLKVLYSAIAVYLIIQLAIDGIFLYSY